MFALLSGASEERRQPILPEAALMRLQEHQQHYARWLLGPAPHAPGDIVTMRSDSPMRGHGSLFMVVEVDRRPVAPERLRRDQILGTATGELTEPPPRSRKTGIREDVRVAFVDNDADSSVRALWIEGWMLEPWSLEQAQQHQQLARAERGTAQ